MKKKKKKISTKLIILLPVFILGIVCILSNVVSVLSIQGVNKNATKIADECMEGISSLSEIQKETQLIHQLGLSHIVATDLDTMISLVDTINAQEATIDQHLADFKVYITEEQESNYQALLEQYEGLKWELANLMAYSANGNNADAYALANGAISTYSNEMQNCIDSMSLEMQAQAASLGEQQTALYKQALLLSGVVIVISVFALIFALLSVLKLVIQPLGKTQKEINAIISGIDHRQGDLTQRVTILSNREVAAVGSGINVFMEKLQDIFKVITYNSQKMDEVVTDVRDSVITSNNSVADLSAMTQELSATMEEMSANAAVINTSAEEVRNEVNIMADQTSEIRRYTLEMKQHADTMEREARQNRDNTDRKMHEIIGVLEKAIEESRSVNQVNSLTEDILSIASQTNLLSLNASIEAARAGEAGRGFAVVAAEISQLATASQEAANHIQTINNIVTQAVNNLASNANELVAYMNGTILPCFEDFAESGTEYRTKATYIESSMEDFSNRMNNLQNSTQEIAGSIDTIARAIEEGVNGIGNAAESTQLLLRDMENIATHMDDNQSIASDLKRETEVFSRL